MGCCFWNACKFEPSGAFRGVSVLTERVLRTIQREYRGSPKSLLFGERRSCDTSTGVPTGYADRVQQTTTRCGGRRSRANNGLRRLIREPQTERISCPPPARDGLFKPFRALSFARKSPRPLPCPLLSMFVVKRYRPDGLTSERYQNHN